MTSRKGIVRALQPPIARSVRNFLYAAHKPQRSPNKQLLRNIIPPPLLLTHNRQSSREPTRQDRMPPPGLLPHQDLVCFRAEREVGLVPSVMVVGAVGGRGGCSGDVFVEAETGEFRRLGGGGGEEEGEGVDEIFVDGHEGPYNEDYEAQSLVESVITLTQHCSETEWV
jgi:hypothetical protein